MVHGDVKWCGAVLGRVLCCVTPNRAASSQVGQQIKGEHWATCTGTRARHSALLCLHPIQDSSFRGQSSGQEGTWKRHEPRWGKKARQGCAGRVLASTRSNRSSTSRSHSGSTIHYVSVMTSGRPPLAPSGGSRPYFALTIEFEPHAPFSPQHPNTARCVWASHPLQPDRTGSCHCHSLHCSH